MIRMLACMALSAVLFVACNRDEPPPPAPPTPAQPATPPVAPAAPAQPAPAPAQPAAAAPAPVAGGPGLHADPVAVVQAVFTAASSGQFAPLGGLCDPQGDGDGDTRRICQVASDPSLGAEFQTHFRSGRVTGPATIEGDRASVPFLFGPDGSTPETMALVQRDGLWYLYSF